MTNSIFEEKLKQNKVALTLLSKSLEQSKIIAGLTFKEKSKRSKVVLALLPSISE
jgi:hypothetical protein